MEHEPIGNQPDAVGATPPAIDDLGASDEADVEVGATSLRADAELTAELEADLAAIEAELEALEHPVP